MGKLRSLVINSKIQNSWRPNESLEEATAGSYSHVRLGYAASVPALLLVTICSPELTGHHWGRINNINYCEIIRKIN